MVTQNFNHIVNAGIAGISEEARNWLIQKTAMGNDHSFTSAYHDDNRTTENSKNRRDRESLAMQTALNANSQTAEFLHDVLDFALDRLSEARTDLHQAQEQDEEMKTALTADTDESLSSYEFKEQLENAPAGDYELTQTQTDMLQTALDKPNLQTGDEEREAMQRALESGVITEADLALVTSGVDAYSQLEAMEAFGTMEAAATTDYQVSQAQRDVQSLEEFQEYLESDDVQQQLENGEITEADIVAQMPQHVRDAYEAENGPIEPAPSEDMVISEGARATSGAASYMESDPELANAPPMADAFGAAAAPQGTAPEPGNAPAPDQQGPTPEETAAYRAQLGSFSL